MSPPGWLPAIYPIKGNVSALRAAWVYLNQIADELKQLETIDVFSDYLITFINQPEAFKQFLTQQRARNGEGPMNIRVENKEAELKTQMAKEGKEIIPEVDEEIRKKNEAIFDRIAKKTNEETKEI